MRITADTNILIRAVVQDDKKQADIAKNILKQAELIAIPLPCLCEFNWVLRSVYRFDPAEIADAISILIHASNVAVDRPAVEAGLAVHSQGGDFADGVIAYEGRYLGGDVFVSLDKQAVLLLQGQGHLAQLAK
jgi:predicted nucleic-acid-binding protein